MIIRNFINLYCVSVLPFIKQNLIGSGLGARQRFVEVGHFSVPLSFVTTEDATL